MRQPRAISGRNLFLTAVQDVITSYFRISVFAGVSRNKSLRYKEVATWSLLGQGNSVQAAKLFYIFFGTVEQLRVTV